MPTPVTLYADRDGVLSFYPGSVASPVPFELADGYHVGEGFTGVRLILGPSPGSLGLSIVQGISRGVLWPVLLGKPSGHG